VAGVCPSTAFGQSLKSQSRAMRVGIITHVTDADSGGMADRVRGITGAMRDLGNDVDIVHLPITKRFWSPRFAPWWYFRPTRAWCDEVADALASYDLVIASYLPAAHAAVRAARRNPESAALAASRLVYDAHNDEARLARVSRPAYERRQVVHMEDDVFSTVAGVWIAGDIDQETLLARYPTSHIVNVPNGVTSLPDLSHLTPTQGEAFVYGSWSYRPNADGLCALASAPVSISGTIVVFGTVPTELERRVTRAASCQPNISWQFAGFAPDLVGLVSSGGTAVVPVWTGGGTKLRTVQLLSMGVAAVVTPEALSGLPGWVANYATVVGTPAEMLQAALHGTPVSNAKRHDARLRIQSELSWLTVTSTGLSALGFTRLARP
jgi:hypothetical protein